MERRVILATAVSVALVTTSATAAVMAAIRPAEAPPSQTVAADQPVPDGPEDAGALASSEVEPVEVETVYIDEYITEPAPAPAPAPAQTLTAATTHDGFDDNGGDRDRDVRVESGDDRDDDGDDDEFEDEDDDHDEFEDDESDDD